jgi:mRNA-degrading endonuclease RelE of RelBE toxin-antitoxin system
VARIVAALERLPAGDIKRLQGVPYERLRVGDYRVILSLSGGGGMVLVHRICNRRDLERVIGQLR